MLHLQQSQTYAVGQTSLTNEGLISASVLAHPCLLKQIL